MRVGALVRDPGIRKALDHLRDTEDTTLRQQIGIAGIAAPTGSEGERAAHLARCFREMGLPESQIDEVGNVLTLLPAHRDSSVADELVVVAAHLDTIFPAGTDTTMHEMEGRVRGPGITDNARGLAGMLAVARAIRAAGIGTTRSLLLVGTVGEEGVGDLRGAKHLLREDSPIRPRVAAFIALDGAGANRVVHRAIGSIRHRVTISGLGGHSWGDRGASNPAHALARAITGLIGMTPPWAGEHAVTVGRMAGGTSVNAIPEEAWLELDLRSEDPRILEWLAARAGVVVRDAVQEEIAAGRAGSPLVARVEEIGNRPCGVTPPDSPLVQNAVEATRLIGAEPELVASSTDANVPIALGIPAISIGAGGRGAGVHTTDEWYENEDGLRGLERALLTILAAAAIASGDQDDPVSRTTTD
jgi:tripeptide aminopeptidase